MGGGHSKAKGAPETMTMRDVLEFATLAGAKATGLESKIGSLTAGKQADIVMIRTDDINLAPVSDAVGAIVLAAHPGNVDSVDVGGRAVKTGGTGLSVDLDQVRDRALNSQKFVLGLQ
jgi:cytosine/adenosine deaminase-related metal-dependent hydrolase